jgi:uncharacterized protein (TIGR03083 family)
MPQPGAYDSPMEIARLYLEGQHSFLELVERLGRDGWSRRVPCTPDWTVRDLLSHQAGVCDDVLNGRIDGAGSDPWTRAQVERWRHVDTHALIAQWREQAPQVAELFQQFSQARPVFDINTHEHDIRHALGLPGNRKSEVIAKMAAGVASAEFERPIAIEFDDGGSAMTRGSGDPITVSDLTPFELVRSRLGRRTRQQVAGYTWSEPVPESILDQWFIFGPAPHPIHE